MAELHLNRYRELALLFTRYGRDFNVELDADDPLSGRDRTESQADVNERAKSFAASLREMGPTFVKFGQLLSTRPDLVPPPYIRELEALQDQVEPFGADEVKSIIERELHLKIGQAFRSFDPVPLAAASLGQVHQAELLDGRSVVIKVQRPNVREVIESDLDVFRQISTVLESRSAVARKMNLIEMTRQARMTILGELDYLQEARNTIAFRINLEEFPDIYVPAVVEGMTTECVLTTELIEGKKVSRMTALDTIEHDYAGLAAQLTRAYLKQICVDGFWHSDPHPGNIFISEGRLILLDFGMVGRIGARFRDEVVRLLLSIAENRGEDVAESFIRFGQPQEKFDREIFIRDISELVTRYFNSDLGQTSAGDLLFKTITIANRDELKAPAELALLAKTLLQLDMITRTLDPDFNPRAVLRDYAEELVAKSVRERLRPRALYGTLLDFNDFVTVLPRRLRDVGEQLPAGKLTFNVRLPQADDFLRAAQRVANRITMGLVIAALIVGSALLGRAPSRFSIFGYPTVAVVGFVAASILGFYIVIATIIQDRRDREKARMKMK
jgi:ubiquinone biosynthesis protein